MSAPAASAGPRVGRPAPAALVSAYLGAALLSWVAATVAVVTACGAVAAGELSAPRVLLAVHLVALGVLPLAVTGAALHVLPTLLRTEPSRRRGLVALPLLCAGPVLAVGISLDAEPLLWPAATAESLGFALVAWELVALAVRAPRGRLLLTSRTGVVLSTLHAAAALAFGAALAAAGGRSLWGIPYERALAMHLHLAVLGWLTLLLLTVGRTLGPMLALAPSAGVRRLPLEELLLTGGLWLLLVGLALGVRPAETVGGLAALAAVGRFAAVLARAARERHTGFEAPLVHFLAGLLFLAQAAVLGLGTTLGLAVTPRRLVAYVVALLVGWAAGATLGHVGKLLSLSIWTWWPPGPRPKQGALYARWLWLVEAAAFALGLETVVAGALAGSRDAVAGGGSLLVVAALLGCAGAARTLLAGGPALRRRGLA